jgi:hypothetical protein
MTIASDHRVIISHLAQIVVPSASAAELTFSDFPPLAEEDVRLITVTA